MTTSWGAVRSMMSDGLRTRLAAEEREEARERAREAREQAARAERWQEGRVRLAIEMARERGETFSVAEAFRTGGASIAMTKSEALDYYSAVQDAEDAHNAQVAARQIERISKIGVEAFYEEWVKNRPATPGASFGPAEVSLAKSPELREKLDARHERKARDRHTATIAEGVVKRVLGEERALAWLRRQGYRPAPGERI